MGVLAPAAEWAHPEANLFSSNQEELFAYSAWKRGCKVNKINKTFMVVDSGVSSMWFALRMSEKTSVVARLSANDKQVSHHILKMSGLKVAKSRSFSRAEKEEAWKFASSLSGAVVTKPLTGFGGKGVTLRIEDYQHFGLGWNLACEFGNRVVVEEMISRVSDYRVLVIQDQVVAVAQRWPASVVGNGALTIEELVAEKDAKRKAIPYVGSKRFVITEPMIRHLARSQLSPESVPQLGQKVQLHEIANISSGGDSQDVTLDISAEFCEIAIRAKRAFPGLFQAGVDILAEDISKSPDQQTWVVCEVNANPDTSLHHYPVIGRARDVTGSLVEALFPETRGAAVRRKITSLRISGKVQGVGYRRWLRKAARQHALTGWVRNKDSNVVEALLQGPVAAVDAVEALCWQGPSGAKVTSLEHLPLNENSIFDRFHIK